MSVPGDVTSSGNDDSWMRRRSICTSSNFKKLKLEFNFIKFSKLFKRIYLDFGLFLEKLKNRVRAFTGAFVVMISPVLLAIVLKKVSLTGTGGRYQGRIRLRALEAFVDLVQRRFAHLAAVTLQMGIMPFLCVMVAEACASLPPLSYVAPRLVAACRVLVFLSNLLLMALGCGILLLFHSNALLVLTICSAMALGVAAVQIRYLCRGVADAGATDDAEAEEYHSKLEQLLELSAGMTVMMFLVLEFVALESLLRNTRQGQAVKRGQTFLGVALLVSFMASTLGVSLMNVWTTPHVISGCVVLTAEFMRVLNFSFHALPIAAVVVLITLDVLPHAWKLAVWLPFFPLVIVLLVLLARAATVLLGLLWRLLTHEAEPPSCVLQAANHASFSAHMSIFLAGIAFWVMAAFALH
ncbi:hypothetical protein Zm00014a_041960 [Zea mays]|uniref:Transmembrane protein n=1 Tax=Zea mays TaxID=4577 RepID=A0A3L6DLG6_MAIZE|nr:hypothetical protein Zm00014a_041960 [Zea mays]